MRRYCAVFFFALFFPLAAEASQQKRAVPSYFTLYGQRTLWSAPSCTDESYSCTVLPHEGGLRLHVLELGTQEQIRGSAGQWLYIVTVAPFWTTDARWIPSHTRFWIFLSDEEAIHEYSE
ncbi:MAG: hypothetical protein IJ191_01175 [Treponema sp.]|nr:hypothetical protein [Treponema sp.]